MVTQRFNESGGECAAGTNFASRVGTPRDDVRTFDLHLGDAILLHIPHESGEWNPQPILAQIDNRIEHEKGDNQAHPDDRGLELFHQWTPMTGSSRWPGRA